MRTQDEIVARIEARQDDDCFGFEICEYLPYLDYSHAKAFLKDEVGEDDWNAPRDISKVKDEMKDYMEFAWDKANNCRGISANRSISHYVAWLWLDGQTEMADSLEENYEFYGKPQLVQVCEYLELDHKQWDDGRRSNVEY